ncbi:MAG: hypothetical protein ABEI99_03865 [Halobaculum sp.]
MSETIQRLRSVCDRLPKSRLDEQYGKLSTAERFAVLGGSAAAVVVVGEFVAGEFFGGGFAPAVLVLLAFGIFSALTDLLARRHD